MDISKQLDDLAEARAQRDALALRKQDAIDGVITEEIKALLADIDLEFSQQAQAVDANIAELEAGVKLAVLAGGQTVKGASLMAVWNKPRITWDDRILQGIALNKPEILIARKEGEPSVTIRQASR